ncbi:MAG: MBL fold metallo-hydrolase [Candidatus Lokiarchaeota archaeon]|nr:MBL fold metallo-hydrolase [Candidatus Harpocratesius repetitus]
MHPILIIFLFFLLCLLATLIIWVFITFRPIPTREIFSNGKNLVVYALKDRMVNSYLIQSTKATILIDAGISNTTIEAIKSLGISPASIQKVFLTHSDYDHVGSVQSLPNAKIYLNKKEIPLITGKTPRFGKKRFNSITRSDFIGIENENPIQIEDITIKPVFTPGHTIGHTCFLLNDCVLFTGDTLRLLPSGKIIPFILFVNMNNAQQRESIARIKSLLAEHPIQIMATGHSGIRKFE